MSESFLMRAIKNLFLIAVGGFAYCIIEILFRGYTHWSMGTIGGLCFFYCGQINEDFSMVMPVWKQMLICGSIITVVEFGAGLVLNLWLGLDIWDYSNIPFNVFGQICLPFSLVWIFLSLPAIILDDYLRYWFFEEEKPHYRWK